MPRAILGFVALSVAFLVAYALGPEVEARQGLYFVSHVVSAGAFTVGVFTSRLGFRRDWLIMLVAMYIWIVCDLLAVFDLDEQGMPRSWAPSLTLSLLAYTLMTVGVFRLAHRDGFVRGSSVRLDGAVFLVSTLMCWWLLVGQEAVDRYPALTPGMIVAGIAPVGDGLLLAAASALSSSRAAHSISSRFLIAAALAGLAGDFGFARIAFGHHVALDSVIPALWMIQFSCASVAALASGHPASRERRRMTVAGIALVVAALVVPLLFALHSAVVPQYDLRIGPLSLVVLTVGTATTTTLVAVRAELLLRRLARQAADIERTARTDELTNLPNRRAGDRLLEDAIAAAHTGCGAPLCVAVIDLDHFKRVNDTHGHQHGDHLLRGAAQAWTTALAARGTLFRYGGEEFVLVLPGTGVAQADRVVADLRSVTPFGQTFSAGVAALRPGEDAGSLVGRADASLYAAKAAGRARTVQAA